MAMVAGVQHVRTSVGVLSGQLTTVDCALLTAPHGFEPGDWWAEHGGPDRRQPAVRRLTCALGAWVSPPPLHRRRFPEALRYGTSIRCKQGLADIPRAEVRALPLDLINA